MTSATHFKSSGVTYPYPASRTWGLGLPILLLGLAFGYKVASRATDIADGLLLCVFGLLTLMALWMIWFGAASIIGAVRRSIGVNVTLHGVSNATIFGIRWANWSSLGPFVEGTFNAGKQGVLPCVAAPIIGHDASKILLKKQVFLIPNVFGIPVHQLAGELNNARLRGALPAPPPVPKATESLIQSFRRIKVKKPRSAKFAGKLFVQARPGKRSDHVETVCAGCVRAGVGRDADVVCSIVRG